MMDSSFSVLPGEKGLTTWIIWLLHQSSLPLWTCWHHHNKHDPSPTKLFAGQRVDIMKSNSFLYIYILLWISTAGKAWTWAFSFPDIPQQQFSLTRHSSTVGAAQCFSLSNVKLNSVKNQAKEMCLFSFLRLQSRHSDTHAYCWHDLQSFALIWHCWGNWTIQPNKLTGKTNRQPLLVPLPNYSFF